MNAVRHCLALLGLLAFAGCASGPAEPTLVRGRTMGTTYSVKYVGPVPEADARRAIETTLVEVNHRFSTYQPDSEISRFNAHRSLEPFEASEEFVAAVGTALELAEKTGGAYDPTVLPVIDLAGFGPSEKRRIPSDAEIDAALVHVGYDKIAIVGPKRLKKSDPLAQLDLSGFAKGYGVDRVGECLGRLGLRAWMVEIGGEVRCAGDKPGGEAWRIGIEQPGSGPGHRIVEEVVELRDAALATSGDYRNFVESGGVRIHHIIDPHTGRNPPDGPVSVSVLASSCGLADGLATALMVRGPDGAEAVLDAFGDPKLRVLFLLRKPGGGVEPHGVRWKVTR